MNVKRFAAPHEFQSLHAKSKAKIMNFVKGHFHQHLDFDLDKTLFLFTAGRYEYRNKGADMFIESLARLNHKLKSTGSDKTVIAFLIFQAKTNSFNVDSMHGQATVKSMKDTVHEIQENIGSRLLEACMQGNFPSHEDGFEWLSSSDIIKLKRIIYARDARDVSQHYPPICTHNMASPNDPILAKLRECNLINAPSDRVKIVFHPEFLKETSPLLPMVYEEFVRGCHMGVFPSYYEPWGYTPAECTVMGIPNISTNLSGFGCFMEQRCSRKNTSVDYGVYVLDRKHKHPNESCDELADIMFKFVGLSRRQRIIMRNRTERLSEHLDWQSLGSYYQRARVGALSKVIDFFGDQSSDTPLVDFEVMSQHCISRPQSIYGDIASDNEGKTPPTTPLAGGTFGDFGIEEVHNAMKQLSCNDDGTVRFDHEEINTIMRNSMGKLAEGGSFSSKG